MFYLCFFLYSFAKTGSFRPNVNKHFKRPWKAQGDRIGWRDNITKKKNELGILRMKIKMSRKEISQSNAHISPPRTQKKAENKRCQFPFSLFCFHISFGAVRVVYVGTQGDSGRVEPNKPAHVDWLGEDAMAQIQTPLLRRPISRDKMARKRKH